MATEHLPEMPDLRSLRLAYAIAIAASNALEDEHDAMLDKAHASFDAVYQYTGLLRTATRRVTDAVDAEVAAGRAYMAHLQEVEPACTQCEDER